MYWAKERGIIASINPYAAYINKDINFANQIIGSAKYLTGEASLSAKK